MIDLSQQWVIPERLDVRQREILFLTAEALGLEIYPKTRYNVDIEEFPYVCKGSRCDIAAATSANFAPYVSRISYSKMLEFLQNKVRSQLKIRNMSKTMFYHTKADGSQSVRYTVAGRVTENTIELCACRYSETDLHPFEKSKGRRIASGRLKSDKSEVKEKYGTTFQWKPGDDGRGLSRAFLAGAQRLIEQLEARVQADRKWIAEQKALTRKNKVVHPA